VLLFREEKAATIDVVHAGKTITRVRQLSPAKFLARCTTVWVAQRAKNAAEEDRPLRPRTS
jgi:hypothetical protein